MARAGRRSIPWHLDLEFVGAAKYFVMLDQPDVFYSLLDKALAK